MADRDHLGRFVKGGNANSKNSQWKGNKAGYQAIHNWIYRRKGKAVVCEDCGYEGRCHWANISGLYKRDVADFKSLCPSCHLVFDKLVIIPRGGSLRVL